MYVSTAMVIVRPTEIRAAASGPPAWIVAAAGAFAIVLFARAITAR